MERGRASVIVVVWLAMLLAVASQSAMVDRDPQHTRKVSAPPSIVGQGRGPLRVAFASATSPPPAATEIPPATATPWMTAPPTPSVAVATDEDSLAFHRQEFDRLNAQIAALEAELEATERDLQSVDDALVVEWSKFETQFDTITRAALPSPRGARLRNLRCLGWKKTSLCQWQGKRDPAGDKSCFAPVVDSSVGFCVVRDEDTDEYFRVMRSDCAAIAPRAFMSCRHAPAFANFPAEIERVVLDEDSSDSGDDLTPASQTPMHLGTDPSNGIVLLFHPSQADHAEALVVALRAFNCQLPVELWSLDETAPLDALASRLTTPEATVTARMLELGGSWYDARVHAIAHSRFDQVLYLDTDTIPLRDPTYLFSLPEFLETGTLFWPDLFHPDTTDSNIQLTSLLWEYLDMPFVNMFEQDDRQLLIRRDTLQTRRGLRLVRLFATHTPSMFSILNLVKNSKDHFRLAWLKARLPFSMVHVPPAIGGSAIPGEPYKLCGSHVVQHDPSGEMLFLHRQSDALESAERDTFAYLQSLDWRRDLDTTGRTGQGELMRAYQVGTFRATEGDTARCYGFLNSADPATEARVTTTRWKPVKPVAAAVAR